ncbi:MAG: aminomethyl-transferring glycine dehydrogenase [Saprospiraceae bacterium]|nr:aminomethyl-transferring glycine dehydrogenase [Saprospiraceae bacterium]
MKSLFEPVDTFAKRHIGINDSDLSQMLDTIGISSLDELIRQTVPNGIRLQADLSLPKAMSEHEYLEHILSIAQKNKVAKNFIGQGYFGTLTPSVILRNVLENPGWYTQYTPYQAEISQGRLEALLNYQTMVSDLTGLPIANASLLDEATAASEAMTMFYGEKNKRSKDHVHNEFFISNKVLPQTIDVILTRAIPLGIQVVVGDWERYEPNENTFGILLQYPDCEGKICDFRDKVTAWKNKEVFICVATDLMSLALLTPPGEWGADCVVGNSQRFGVPMGYGGPHAAFFATKDDFKRSIPGRIIGVSTDNSGKPALRMALQTREQHIRREKATSNICTAQALLANMAGFYAVFHGQKGIKQIATRIHALTQKLAKCLIELNFTVAHNTYFDTISVVVDKKQKQTIAKIAAKEHFNFYFSDNNTIQISVDETHSIEDIRAVVHIFELVSGAKSNEIANNNAATNSSIPSSLVRQSDYLTHPVFNKYHTESQMMRYIKRLENKDLSLIHSMISLGSCTMKLNAASEMIPISWSNFANIHPFAPATQTAGYKYIIDELSKYLCEITGFKACSLQPNSGAQGEYAGLLCIRAYHQANGDYHRNIALIPSSAHGTNPASAVMAGMQVIVVACDDMGNIDVNDLKIKAEEHRANLACLMVTYPSTHGVFEASIKEICDIIHQYGGKVYMDGANMNAQVGLTSPAEIGADVCHLNLHKTFAIPHGGGGPGVGPICVNDSLAPFLPSHYFLNKEHSFPKGAVSAAPFGSANILVISYGYIRMLGADGLKASTKYAILNANYIKARLENEFSVLYKGEHGRTAHELIIDLRPFKSICSAEDIAKRLMDYSFHAPTLSFPVAGTIMIEPTESEDKDELDRFCDALLQIKIEIDEIARGEFDHEDNVLHNAPHTQQTIVGDWTHSYSREKAAFPLPYLKEGYKFWATVGRIDQAKGDRQLICTCPPLESYINK